MKRLLFVFGFLVASVACQNGNNQNLDFSNCLSRRCDNSLYAKYANQGFSPFNNSVIGGMPYLQYVSGYGGFGINQQLGQQQWGAFCGCPTGSTPTYHPMIGLGCVTNFALQKAGYATVLWYLPPGSHQLVPVDASQASAYVQNPYYQTCAQVVAETCFVNQPEACMNGNVCRPTDYGATLGFCARQ